MDDLNDVITLPSVDAWKEVPPPTIAKTTIVLLADIVLAEVLHALYDGKKELVGRCLRIVLMTGDWSSLNERTISVGSEHPDFVNFLSAIDQIIDNMVIGGVCTFHEEVRKVESSPDKEHLQNYPVCVEISANEIAPYIIKNTDTAVIKVNYRAETL